MTLQYSFQKTQQFNILKCYALPQHVKHAAYGFAQHDGYLGGLGVWRAQVDLLLYVQTIVSLLNYESRTKLSFFRWLEQNSVRLTRIKTDVCV